MTRINENYLKLTGGYLFSEIARLVKTFREENPSANLVRLDIGDVTEPLAPAVIQAMHAAVDEMAVRSSFRGYGPEQGHGFLREAIAKNDYQSRGADIDASEIFVSDGSKCDSCAARHRAGRHDQAGCQEDLNSTRRTHSSLRNKSRGILQ